MSSEAETKDRDTIRIHLGLGTQGSERGPQSRQEPRPIFEKGLHQRGILFRARAEHASAVAIKRKAHIPKTRDPIGFGVLEG